jgi:uncharacterized hydrophobic protein (TIGR00271 family)
MSENEVRPKALVLVTDYDKVGPLIRWAAMFARGGAADLVVLCCGRRGVATSATAGEPGLIVAAREVLAGPELKGVSTELLAIVTDDIVEAALAEVEREGIRLLIAGADGTLGENAAARRITERVLQFSPCDTIVIDTGEDDGTGFERVLVPYAGRFRTHALQTAASLAHGNSGVAVPFLVGSFFGKDSEDVAMRELAREVEEAGIEQEDLVSPLIDVSSKPLSSIVSRSRDCDLVLFGASSTEALRRLRGTGSEGAVQPVDRQTVVAVTRYARSAWRSVFSRKGGSTPSWVPALRPKERVDVFDRVQAGARLNADFIVMLTLSTAIASFGLMQGSTAVVIGAMLVAPLMTPIIGSGLALIQGNTRLFRESMKALMFGVLAGLLISALIGVLTGALELTPEVMSRSRPTLLDLAVALLSGMAVAYALARPSLAGAIAGVAIATALVPPLSVVGISLAHHDLRTAFGAAVLFSTNIVAIVLGAALVFRVLGIGGESLGVGRRLWVRRTLLALSLASIMLVLPLWQMSTSSLAVGQSRAAILDISNELRVALNTRVNEEPAATMLIMGRPHWAPDRISLILTVRDGKAVPPELEEDLVRIVRDIVGQYTPVHVVFLQDLNVYDARGSTPPIIGWPD